MKWIKLALLFLVIAFAFAFALVPWFQVFIGTATVSDWMQRLMSEFRFDSTYYWKSFLTYYLALWCGKAIFWALATAPSKPNT